MNNFPIKTVTVESDHPKVTAEVQTVKEGQEYRIVVTPSETDQPIMAKLTIKTDYPKENPKSFEAHVRIDPKR